ncbi:MAG: metallophosphoesterase family protein [Planctomycetota bacterium]|jgi:DNA repair exonuclease SbcCD nuclease subunit
MTLAAVRFLHTADWQLGMRRHFLGEEAQPRFMQARIDAIRTMGRVAREQACAFVVVAGDVFESNQVDRRTLARSAEALRDIELPVYLLPGNHDPLDAATIFTAANFAAAPNVRLLTDARPVEAAPGVEVVGAPWPNKRPRRDLVGEAITALKPGCTRIVVGHGIVDSLSPDPDDPARIRLAPLRAALDNGAIHYVALGDRHSATEVADRVWYAGAPEPTDFSETDAGRALVVEIADGACSVEPHQIGDWRFMALAFELDSTEQVEQLARDLDALPRKETTIVKLSLRGALSLRAMARLEELLATAESRFAALTRWERHTDLVTLPDELDLDALGLAGFARATAARLAARRDDPRSAGALALLYRLAGGPRA